MFVQNVLRCLITDIAQSIFNHGWYYSAQKFLRMPKYNSLYDIYSYLYLLSNSSYFSITHFAFYKQTVWTAGDRQTIIACIFL